MATVIIAKALGAMLLVAGLSLVPVEGNVLAYNGSSSSSSDSRYNVITAVALLVVLLRRRALMAPILCLDVI
ncbi:MAG TPA: hypothetical protein VKA91_01070 [Nitrososphaeraceae archaeon]|nr:hypothetical protein [Nitrososphaeraceae archaeon]